MKKLIFIAVLLTAFAQSALGMIIGPAMRVECPECGAVKRLMTTVSGNSFGARRWSDMYMVAPMMPRLSPIQKCLDCGHYYLLDRAKYEMEERDQRPYAYDLGRLTYPEMKEALCLLRSDSLSTEEEITIRMEFLHRYNDALRKTDDLSEEEGFLEEYRTMSERMRTDEDMKLHQDNVKVLLRLLDDNQYGLLKAELYRESGEFEKCIELLKKYWTYDAYENRIIEKLMRKAYEEDDRLFRLDEQ